MIQDAHPVRSGVPDCYRALYKIDIVSAGATWTVNMERFPSGFGGAGAAQNAFVSLGRGDVVFPPGMRVRGATAELDNKAVTAATQFDVNWANINETLGTASLIVTDRATPTLQNPTNGSVIYAVLELETV